MADEPSNTPANDAGAQDNGQQPASKTFTQEDVDRLLKDRLARQKQQFDGKLSEYDELKSKAEKLDEIENSRKTEAEKLLAAIEKYKTEAQQAVEREQKANERANQTLVRAAVVREAARAKAVDPDDVYALAGAHGLLGDVKIGDDGQVAGVREAVEALLSDRPHLVGQRPPGGFDGGARQTAPAETSSASFNAQLRKEAGFA